MSDKIPIKILNAIYNGRWAIKPENLSLIVSIVSRTHSDISAVLAKPAERRESGKLMVRDGVAIINMFGPIVPRADAFSNISGAVSVDTLALRFGEAINAPDVKGIIFDIDSPGGNITNVNEFANQIYEARGIKPIVAYTSGLCASAAYWIASATDKIIADKTAFIGSIGVVATWTDDSVAREREGVCDYELISSQSPLKRQDLSTDTGLASLQSELDALAEIFIQNVARNRGVGAQVVGESFGQGGVMIADDAMRVGMSDGIGNLESVIKEMTAKPAKVKFSINSNQTEKGANMSNKKDDDKRKARAADDPDDDEDTGKEDKEDEDDEKESKAADDMASLLASNPALFNRIKLIGVAEERARIKAIDEIGATCGYSDSVKSAMFDDPITAADLALRVVKSEGQSRALLAKNYKADAADIPSIPAMGASDPTADNSTHNKVVTAMVSGLVSRGHKEAKHA